MVLEEIDHYLVEQVLIAHQHWNFSESSKRHWHSTEAEQHLWMSVLLIRMFTSVGDHLALAGARNQEIANTG